jgi:hypothetical protein
MWHWPERRSPNRRVNRLGRQQLAAPEFGVPLFQRSLAPLHPFVAEIRKGFDFQDPFGHREHDAFLLLEMFARRGDDVEQKFPGVLERAGFLDAGEHLLDQLVLVMKRLLVPDLVEAMFQRRDEQFVLRVRMRRHDFVQQQRERFHLRRRLELRRVRLNVIEQVMEHRVFRAQNVGDLHVFCQLA